MHLPPDATRPLRGRHSGARAKAREPGIDIPELWLWIPGPPLRGVPE